MSTAEYLAFLPLLIYGIALADLLGEWKRLFNPKSLFIPYILFTAMLTELAIYNVYVYMNLVSSMVGMPYYQYLLSLLPPFLFMLTVNIFTPNTNENTKDYFLKNKRLVYILMGLFMLSHFFFNFEEGIYAISARVIGVVFFIALGFTKKTWSLYLPIVLWLLLIITRIFMTI